MEGLRSAREEEEQEPEYKCKIIKCPSDARDFDMQSLTCRRCRVPLQKLCAPCGRYITATTGPQAQHLKSLPHLRNSEAAVAGRTVHDPLSLSVEEEEDSMQGSILLTQGAIWDEAHVVLASDGEGEEEEEIRVVVAEEEEEEEVEEEEEEEPHRTPENKKRKKKRSRWESELECGLDGTKWN